jgi:hypothetical protein
MPRPTQIEGSSRKPTRRPSPEKPSANAEPAHVNGVTRGPTHEEIARRAYELYLARGAQPGNPDEDWAQAERELRLGRY